MIFLVGTAIWAIPSWVSSNRGPQHRGKSLEDWQRSRGWTATYQKAHERSYIIMCTYHISSYICFLLYANLH